MSVRRKPKTIGNVKDIYNLKNFINILDDDIKKSYNECISIDYTTLSENIDLLKILR